MAYVAVLGAIGMLLFFMFVLPSRRVKGEAGKELLYEETCSGRRRIGFVLFAGGNLPTWRVSFYPTSFVIAPASATVIPYDHVEFVRYARQIVSKGVHIKVRDPSIDIVLFPADPEKMLNHFTDKGIRVSRA